MILAGVVLVKNISVATGQIRSIIKNMQVEHGLFDDIAGIETNMINAIFLLFLAPFLSIMNQ
jgi:hypothetical protein